MKNWNGRNGKLVKVCLYMGRTTKEKKNDEKSGRKTKEQNQIQDNENEWELFGYVWNESKMSTLLTLACIQDRKKGYTQQMYVWVGVFFS